MIFSLFYLIPFSILPQSIPFGCVSGSVASHFRWYRAGADPGGRPGGPGPPSATKKKKREKENGKRKIKKREKRKRHKETKSS